MVVAGVAGAAPDNCPIDGEPVQWMADYCLAQGQTDDLEAVMPCIEKAGRLQFGSDCAAKRHFKRLLCEASFAGSPVYKNVGQCIDDPGFVGPTVQGNGSGG